MIMSITYDQFIELKRGDLLEWGNVIVIFLDFVYESNYCTCIHTKNFRRIHHIDYIDRILESRINICRECLLTSTCNIDDHIITCYKQQFKEDNGEC